MNKLAVITTYFNYSKSKLVRFAYDRFSENLRNQGVDLYTVELAFKDDDYQLPPSEKTFKLKSDSVLWHKEAMFNYALKQLPDDVTNVAWLDADIVIHNNNWAVEANKLLDRFSVIQIGNIYRFLTNNGDVDHVRETAVKVYTESPDLFQQKNIHVGLAWAAKRETLDKIKFFDYDIAGGNDTIIFACSITPPDSPFLNWLTEKVIAKNCPPLLKKIEEYHHRCWEEIQGRVSYLPVVVDHIYHSEYANRQYVTRYECIKGFDPDIDLERQENGLFAWKNENFEKKMERYFITKDATSRLEFKKNREVALSRDESNLVTLHITFDPKDYTPVSISHDRSKDVSYDPLLDRHIDDEVKASIRKLIRFRRGLDD